MLIVRLLAVAAATALAGGAAAQSSSPPPPPTTDTGPATTVSGLTVVGRRPTSSSTPRLELYEGRDFTRGGLIVVEATPNLLTRGFSDQARSARAVSGSWQLCNGPDYTPPCTVVTGDVAFLGDMQLSERVSSARPLAAPAAER